MSGLLGGRAQASTPEIAGFRVQTSVYGLPIPIVYGQARLAGNLIHYIDGGHAAVTQGGAHIGKIRLSKPQQTGWTYKAAVAIALSEGPVVGIGKVWADKDAAVAFTTYQADGWSLFTGTAGQAPWSYLSTYTPPGGAAGDQAVPYQLTAYVAHPALVLPDDVLPNFSWEVKGFLAFGGGVLDASPKDVLVDYLSNTDHGLGFPAAQLGNLASYQDYVCALGLFLSPVIDTQAAAAGQIQDLLDATNSAAVWSDGTLKFVPYGDEAATGNGHTFTPNTTPIYDLTDDDHLGFGEGEDPIQVTRKRAADVHNRIAIEYENRGQDYAPDIAEAKDDESIRQTQVRSAPTVTLHAIKDAAVARLIAQLRLQREQNIRNTYRFRLGWRFALLEPMDLLTLTDAALGLARTPVRITSVEDLDDNSGIEVIAEEWPTGTASATRYSTQSGSGSQPAANADPGNTTTPMIVEAPAQLAAAPLELWIGASGGANWGGCEVWASSDNVTFFKVGALVSKAAYGVLTAALASAGAYPPADTTHTLALDLSVSGGALVSGSATDLANAVTLCYVDGEWLAFQTATLTGLNAYNLTTLARGLYGSAIPASHASGTVFLRIDGAVLRVSFPQAQLGQTWYFKFPAFNQYGAELQDVSLVAGVAHTIGQTPKASPAPYLWFEPGTQSQTSEDVVVNGSIGQGAPGPLTWRYSLNGGTTWTPGSGYATSALPQTLTITRDPYYTTKLLVEVHQGDGQTDRATFSIAGAHGAIDTGTGRVKRAVPLDDGDYTARGDSGGVALPTGVDFSRAYTGKHAANLPRSGTDVTTVGVIVGQLDNTGAGSSSFGVVSASTARAVARGIEAFDVADGGSVTFSPVFSGAPLVLMQRQGKALAFPNAGGTWTGGAYNAASNTYLDLRAYNITASACNVRARFIQYGTPTTVNVEFTSPLSVTTAGSSVGVATISSTSNTDQYTCRCRLNVSCDTTGHTNLGSVRATIILESNDGSTGWQERYRDTKTESNSSGGVTNTNYDYEITASVSGMASGDTFRWTLVTISKLGDAVGGANSTATLTGNNGVNNNTKHGVSYITTPGDVYQSVTPVAGDTVHGVAMDIT